jgi:hypothetical protein
MLGTYAVYLVLLRRVARENFRLAFVLIYPTILIEIVCGQNGFVTGAFVGLFALAMLRGKAVAGVPLGLMAIKPHLALGLVLFVLLNRRWDVLGVAIVTTLISLALATLAFGAEIWPAFLTGAHAASANLANGSYPMHRMTSIFATLVSRGVPKGTGLVVQGVAALAVAAAIVMSHLRGAPVGVTLGLSCIATLALSPYNYDYDLPIFGIGLALILPDLLARIRLAEGLVLSALYWVAAGTGLMSTIGNADLQVALSAAANKAPSLTVAGACYLVLFGLVTFILRRQPAPLS